MSYRTELFKLGCFSLRSLTAIKRASERGRKKRTQKLVQKYSNLGSLCFFSVQQQIIYRILKVGYMSFLVCSGSLETIQGRFRRIQRIFLGNSEDFIGLLKCFRGCLFPTSSQYFIMVSRRTHLQSSTTIEC